MLPILSPFRTTDGGVFSALRRDVDRLVDDAFTAYPGNVRAGTFLPPVDIDETVDAIRVQLEVAGINPDDIDVTVENGVLMIEGEKKVERKEGDKERGMFVERQYGRFQRVFTLPAQVDADNVNATYDNGVLKIEIPKRSDARPRRIQIGKPGEAARHAAQSELGRGEPDREVENPRADERTSRRTTAETGAQAGSQSGAAAAGSRDTRR